jgi:hypothetical protein
VLAQHFGDCEDEVRRGCTLVQTAGQFHSHDQGNQHRHWLAKHGRFGFNAPYAPSEHAETVDHRRVRIGAYQRVGIRHELSV